MGQDAYPDIHHKAAALLHSLIRNHPFVDGNKRTAMLAAIVFYGLNGWAWHADDLEVIALAVDIAEGVLDVPAIAKRLAEMTQPIENLPEE